MALNTSSNSRYRGRKTSKAPTNGNAPSTRNSSETRTSLSLKSELAGTSTPRVRISTSSLTVTRQRPPTAGRRWSERSGYSARNRYGSRLPKQPPFSDTLNA
eukprot:PhF_6_TR36517/c0_g2_i3/m.53786